MKCKCGGTSFTSKAPVRGVWVEWFDWSKGVMHREATTDGVQVLREPKTMRCDRCGKRHKRPDAAQCDTGI